jgi:chemotaxis protein CheZ
MQNGQRVKEFSVERRLRARQVSGQAGSDQSVGVGAGADAGQLLSAIEELRAEIKALRGSFPAGSPVSEGAPAELTDSKEALEARIEIAQMVRMIGQTKLEIASIKHPMAEDDRMLAAAGELDAIVVATEASTQDVLAASENIETLVRKIAGLHHDDEEVVTATDQVGAEIIKIFEACNFQDITGQRINKVIKIIRFIEERILSMISIWGAQAFTELPIPESESAEGDDALMNGPQLENQGITQDEINALFD